MDAPPTTYRHPAGNLERRDRSWSSARAGLTASVLAAVACGLVILAAWVLGVRGAADDLGGRLADRADVLAASADPVRPLASRVTLRQAGGALALRDGDGTVVVRTGPPELWRAGAPGLVARAASLGARWSLRDGVVQAERETASGGRLQMRAALPAGAAPSGPDALLLAVMALPLVLGAGLLVAWRAARRTRALERLAAAAEGVAAGRADVGMPPVDAGLAPLAAAITAAGRRVGDLQDAAEARFDAVGATLAPLAVPVAARTPLGGRVRNGALERLVRGARPEDAQAIEGALAEGLAARGACTRQVRLSDGRILEADAWSVTGGRVVALVDRTEQERLAGFRRRITGAAARHLHSPVSEVQALASDLHAHVPASSAPSVARILSAADRMERLVSTLLRGTEADPLGRPARPAAIGAAGLFWGLARRYDDALRARELRLHPHVDEDLPPVQGDHALVEEVLRRLLDNALAWTPRGGDVHLSARRGRDGGVDLEVRDSGPGIAPDELAQVTERFARGAAAAARPGAGLGLASADALARRLGGRLVLAPGPGGRATLALPPLSSAPPPASTVARAEEPAAVA